MSRKVLVSWLFISFLLSLTGPFGTFDTMSVGLRLVYWPGLSALSVLLGFGIILTTEGLRARLDAAMVFAVRVVLYTAIFTPLLRFITLTLVPDEPLRDRPPALLYAIVAAVAASVLILRWAFDRLDHRTRPPAVASPLPRLARRLPEGTKAEIIRLTVNDHYVEAHLSDGTMHRFLMRFSDAINEMDAVPGHCTHRSHWVADRCVTGALRLRGREFLTLSNGEMVPIGRKYRPDLVKAGLLVALTSGEGNGEAPPPGQDGIAAGAEKRV